MSITERILKLRIMQFIGKKYCKYFQPSIVIDEELKRIPEYKRDCYSQLGQDWFVYNVVFKGELAKGFLLDIGANDPENLSNSLFFEKKGWDGIAFEPIPSIHERWKNKRSMMCLNCAVGDKRSEVQFTILGNGGFGSGVSSLINEDGEVITIQQVRIKDILMEKQISHVDYVSIDVEGYELKVLEGIDFEKVDITCLSIENNNNNGMADERIRSFMKGKGYLLVARISIDDIFVKNSFWK